MHELLVGLLWVVGFSVACAVILTVSLIGMFDSREVAWVKTFLAWVGGATIFLAVSYGIGILVT